MPVVLSFRTAGSLSLQRRLPGGKPVLQSAGDFSPYVPEHQVVAAEQDGPKVVLSRGPFHHLVPVVRLHVGLKNVKSTSGYGIMSSLTDFTNPPHCRDKIGPGVRHRVLPEIRELEADILVFNASLIKHSR